jgi:RNA polymerase sigma factor (sigma-70 family)
MQSPAPRVSLDRLLAQRDWVRQMARALVRDGNEADDLEQGVWLAALERPPRTERSLRGWFATALRRDVVDRRRSETCRGRREESQSRPEIVPSAADLVAEADAHRRLVVAVMELPEPYRSTVLYRFFEDVPPSALAARDGLPLDTVRTRLRRALALLREKLDAESPGGREAWCAALLPLTKTSIGAAGSGAAVVGGTVMQTSIHGLVAAAVLGIGGLACVQLAPGPAPQEPPPTETPAPAARARDVSGRVLLLDGRRPVEDAVVTLRAAASKVASIPPITTGSTGEFRFRGVPVGTYVLRAAKTGFADRVASGIAVTDAGGVDGLELLLAAGGAIEGLVTDAKGAPVAGVVVRTRWDGPPAGAAETKSREDGAYRLAGLPPGHHLVEAARGPGMTQTATAAVSEGATIRVDFAATSTLTGVLLDAAGVTVAAADVTVRLIGSTTFVQRRAKTDDAGRFRVEGLEPAEWSIGVQVHGVEPFAANDVTRVTLAVGEQDVVVRIPAGSIAGRVFLKAGGAPVGRPGIQLSLYTLRPSGATWTLGTTAGMAFPDADGKFVFRGLAVGRYRILGHPKDRTLRRCERDVEVADTPVEGIDVALEGASTGTVRFIVRDPDDKPVEGATLCTEKETSAGTVSTNFPMECPEPGVYVARLEAGRIQVIVSRSAPLRFARATVDVVEGRETTVRILLPWAAVDASGRPGAGEISGRMFVRSSRKPLTSKDVQLVLYAVDPWRFVAVASVGADGAFRFQGVPPGSCRIMATPTRPVFRPAQVDVALTAQGSREGVEMAFDACACGKAKFVVVDADGRPLDGVHFMTVKDEGGGRSTSTGFAVDSPSPGMYLAELECGTRSVTAAKDGYEPASKTVTVKETGGVELKLVLRPKR